MKIGFDLDGVILDNTSFKVKMFKELYDMNFEDWQVSSNIIDEYVPDREIRRSVGKLASTREIARILDTKCVEVLAKLKADGNELYIVSRRGKSDDGQKAALRTIKELNLGQYFEDIILCETEEDKINTIINRGINIFIDDRIGVAEGVYGKINCSLLFDNFELVDRHLIKMEKPISCVRSFEDIEREVQKYE